jgi:hypothetical protein
MSLHALHNSFKRGLGSVLGVQTHTIADHDEFIERLRIWKKSGTNISKSCEGDIVRFVSINGLYKKSTVYFDGHWGYRLLLCNLPLLYLDKLLMVDAIVIMMIIPHVLTSLVLPMEDRDSLVEAIQLKQTLETKMRIDKLFENDGKEKSGHLE